MLFLNRLPLSFYVFTLLLCGLRASPLFAQYGQQCLSGDCVNGNGVVDYGPKIGRYEGDFKDGKKDGFGTMYYADGRRWQGKWKKDAFKGGTTEYLPYQPAEELRPAGSSSTEPFADALYRVVATVPDNFKALKGTPLAKEQNKYELWQPKIMLPSASRAYISAKTGECRYYFVETAPKELALKAFNSAYQQITTANTFWAFEDLTHNPAFAYHYKLYKWSLPLPATLLLQMKKSKPESDTYDVYLVLRP